MANWALTTIDTGVGPLACVERGEQLYRLEPVLARAGLPGEDTVARLFEHWDWAVEALESAEFRPEDAVPPGRRLAPLLYPGKVLCAGANYYKHLAEMGMPSAKKEDQRLFFFFKPPRNAVVGEGDTVHMPLGTQSFDWEIELAVVIGRRARDVSAENAMAHVAAYTIGIDFSARDFNRAPETFYKLDWVAGKAHDTCCPLGPRLVPASALPNPQSTRLKLSVNGQIKQDDSTSDMIFSIAEQISIASRIMTLDPGDVLLTGTPAGVGAPRGEFLKVGDLVDAEIEGIGKLSIRVGAPQ